jgi:hypothetical protein
VKVVQDVQLSGTTQPDNQPNNPDVEWTGHSSPFTASALTVTATGTGYADGNTVKYKVTATGVYGETLPSSATVSLPVGTPKKQVNLAWNPITYAEKYRIYREVNASGNFFRIAEVATLSFVDNAASASTDIPPTSNTAEGASFMESFEPPTAVNGGRVQALILDPGVAGIAISIAGSFLNWERGDFVLKPGETMAVLVKLSASGDVSVVVTWDEELPA